MAEAENPEKPPRQRRRVSIVWLLGFGAGTMALLGLAAIGIAILGGIDASVRLLRQQSLLTVDSLIARLTLHLRPAEDVIGFLAKSIEKGDLDPADTARMSAAFVGALAAAPQIDGISYMPSDKLTIAVVRQNGDLRLKRIDLREVPGAEDEFVNTVSQDGLFWGDLIYSPLLNEPVLNVRQRVARNSALAAVVSLGELSRLVSNFGGGAGQRAFILVNQEQVLAHPNLVDRWHEFVTRQRLPNVNEVDDPVLAAMWGPRSGSWISNKVLEGGLGHRVTVDGVDYIFIYREFVGFGPQSWIVGQYLPLADILPLTRGIIFGGAAAAVLLVVAAGFAWRLGSWIGRPVARLAEAAHQIRTLEFEGPDLPRSSLREIDEAATAFNASRHALRWFSLYVPRRLVTRLLAEGEATMVSRRREVTVMFTDIVGFTSMAEQLGEQETAELLNEHFALLARFIEAEGGVIDKFMGDAVMATWGAIKRTEEHAAQACRAARAIVDAVTEQNAQRVAEGLPRIRIRIGLHSGPVVVGNIGSPGRINFTVVGDTVNAAQRLEALGKLFMSESDDVIVLCSEATYRAAGEAAEGDPVGEHHLTGREGTVRVWRLR